jgi:hypothetical protein
MAMDNMAERQAEVIQQRQFHSTGSFARQAPSASASGEPVSFSLGLVATSNRNARFVAFA